ncbi:Folate-biopterin transporter 1, chloroplastic, partial [Mucuna pruriens]
MSRSSLRLNKDDDDSFLGFRIGVGEKGALTTETDLEAASSSKVSLIKHKYSICNIKLFGVDLSPGFARLVVNFYLKDDLNLDPTKTIVILDSMIVERACGK